ncbi:MAG: hypothetical protein ABI548_21430 [Polyangiaceae bacterium]
MVTERAAALSASGVADARTRNGSHLYDYEYQWDASEAHVTLRPAARAASTLSAPAQLVRLIRGAGANQPENANF